MITAADFLKWLSIFNVPSGGGGGGSVTQDEVQQSAFNFATTTGSDDAFVVTLSPAPTELTNGLLITMSSGSLQNLTSSPTLQVNSLAAKPISTFAGAPAPGDIQQGLVYLFIYNGAAEEFELINPTTTTADTFAVQGNVYNYALDSGTANAYIGNVLPVSDNAQIGGFSVLLNAIHTNTGASTLTVNSQEAPIVNQYGNALTGGEIVANSLVTLVYSDHYDSYMLVTPSTTGLPVLLDPAGQQTISTYGLTVPNLTTANMSFDVTTNVIASLGTNAPIALTPNGTGGVCIGNSTSTHGTPGSLWIARNGDAPALGLSSYVASTSGCVEYFFKSRSTTQSAFATVVNGDTIGSFIYLGDDGTQFSSAASMYVQATGTVSTGIVPGQMVWSTTNSSGVLTTGMTLTSAQVLNLANALPPASGGTGTATPPSAGQILIGTSGGVYTPAAINSGAGILVANGSGSITISAIGGGIGWTPAASTPVTAAINTGYVVTDASTVTFTLPVTAAFGSVVRIVGQGAGGWILAPGAGQTIKVITASASTSVASTEASDCIEVVCTVENTTWVTISMVTTGFTIT